MKRKKKSKKDIVLKSKHGFKIVFPYSAWGKWKATLKGITL